MTAPVVDQHRRAPPTAEGVRVRLRGGKLSTVDGPFTETKEVVGVFAILEAGSTKEAIEPHQRFLKIHVRNGTSSAKCASWMDRVGAEA